ncbi:MAG TPA: hypothetical protein PKB02_07890 [Anaerohalosphaeraceae bacterium]|nr:hypothetical protein [Anaerohalosphaeraceae bacterium]
MARKLFIEVQVYPELNRNTKYPVSIHSISISRKPPGIVLVLEHQDFFNRGRLHKIRIPPLYTDGITADIFRSAGCTVRPGEKIDSKELLHKTLVVCFDHDINDQTLRISAVFPYHPGATHDRQ